MTDSIRAALDRLHQYAEMFPEHDTDTILAAARAALAGEQGDGPSDEELDALVERAWNKNQTVGYQGERFMYESDFDSALDLVLARWGHQPARLRNCPTHGQQPPEAWGCPECVRELREELAAALTAKQTPPAEGELSLKELDHRPKLSADDIPPGPFSEHELREQWNQQADEFNQWDSLDSCEQLAWAQARAIQRDRNAKPTPPAVTISALLRPAYEPGDGSADCAQLVNGQWWHPCFGCDSLEIVLNNLLAVPPRPVPVSERLPKPNTKVLAHYFNDLGNGRTICAIWVPAKSWSDDIDDNYNNSDHLEYDETDDCYYWPEGWYETIENWDELGYVKVNEGDVIYWQPLPTWPANPTTT